MNRNQLLIINHIKTGISAKCDFDRPNATIRIVHDKALCNLRSKLWANKNIKKITEIIATYDLPDEIQYPNNLDDYRNLT